MIFTIKMGIPEIKEAWDSLVDKKKKGVLTKSEEELYVKWGKTMVKLATDPFYPSLETHEITPLSKRYGMKVWQSYLENNKSKARRIYWVYGPSKEEITIIGLEPHPEDKKNGAYDRITLSSTYKDD